MSPIPTWVKIKGATLLHPIHSSTHVRELQDGPPQLIGQQEHDDGEPEPAQHELDEMTHPTNHEVNDGEVQEVLSLENIP